MTAIDFHKLAKIELHCHLDGSLSLSTIRHLAELAQIDLPEDDEELSLLLCKLYFYLLSSGISQLNKMGHPQVHDWALKSPDRCYQWAVEGHPECTAYMRVKAGKSRAGRGEYKRAKPFFCMKFDCATSALKILLGTGDMFQMTANKQLIMEGAPEFGVQIGDYMMLVGSLAK